MNSLLLATGGTIAVDLIVIIGIATFIIVGYIQGFSKIVFKALGNIVSLILALVLCVKFVEFLDKYFGLVTAVSSSVELTLPKIFGETLMSTSLESVIGNQDIVKNSGFSSFIMSAISAFIKDSTGIDPTITLAQIIAPTIAYHLTSVIAFIVGFVLIRILLFLLEKWFESMWEIELIKNTDRSLGALVGLIQGIIIIQAIMFVLGGLPFGFLTALNNAIAQSVVAGFINKINIIELLTKALNSFDYIKSLIIKTTT